MEGGAISRRPLVKSLSVGFIATNAEYNCSTNNARFFFHLPSSFHFLPEESSRVERMIDFYFEFKRNLVRNRLLLDRKSREIEAKKKKDRTHIRATSSRNSFKRRVVLDAAQSAHSID